MLGWVITCHDELAQEMLDRRDGKISMSGRNEQGALA